MKNPFNWRMVSTGIAAPLLIFLSSYSKGTGFGWIALPFFMPGLYLATIVFPQGIHSQDRQGFIQLAMTLNVGLVWVSLELAAILFERLMKLRKQHA